MAYLIVLAKKLYWMMITFETTTMLANLTTKLTLPSELFLIDTRTPVMIKIKEIKLEQGQCIVLSV